MILGLVRLKIIDFLLKLNIKIGRRLSFYHTKYSIEDEIEQLVNSQNFDLRGMKSRIKSMILKDKDIIDRRRAICDDCEFKMGLNCKKCGCFIRPKTKIATTSCPIGKWDAEYNFMQGKATNDTQLVVK
tara:strand:- start:340 stop:726 length:387 start_codon:yes stop_codon:yes gene_type:complete